MFCSRDDGLVKSATGLDIIATGLRTSN